MKKNQFFCTGLLICCISILYASQKTFHACELAASSVLLSNPNQKDNNGRPLMLTINGQLLKKLMCARADPDLADTYGNTGLMRLINHGDHTLVQQALDNGADFSLRNSAGHDAYMLAFHYAFNAKTSDEKIKHENSAIMLRNHERKFKESIETTLTCPLLTPIRNIIHLYAGTMHKKPEFFEIEYFMPHASSIYETVSLKVARNKKYLTMAHEPREIFNVDTV